MKWEEVKKSEKIEVSKYRYCGIYGGSFTKKNAESYLRCGLTLFKKQKAVIE